MTQTKSKPTPKSAAKPKSGLVIRTTVKAGDGSTPGMRMNHGTKLAAR
jgi:hypothetical protein